MYIHIHVLHKRIYTHLYVCIFIHICICLYTQMNLYPDLGTSRDYYLYKWNYIYIYTYSYGYLDTYSCMCKHICIYLNVFMHVDMCYIYINLHPDSIWKHKGGKKHKGGRHSKSRNSWMRFVIHKWDSWFWVSATFVLSYGIIGLKGTITYICKRIYKYANIHRCECIYTWVYIYT
jgi:hypothetical protein